MGNYPAYEQCKDSGVEWLGEIPEHWNSCPLKFLINTRKGIAFKSSDFTDGGCRVVKASDIKEYSILESDVYLNEHFKDKYPNAVLKKGEIILSTVGSIPRVKNSAVGQVGLVPEHLDQCLLNQNTVIFTPNISLLIRKYLFYILISKRYRDYLDLHAHGTANQASLNLIDMLAFKSPIPPTQEQKTIALFLDYKTRQIDALIAKQEALLEKLEEKRSALISHSVTKGLDPTVPMKDSEIEWLGEIPEHWKIIRVRRLLIGNTQNGLYKSKDFFDDSGIPLIQMGEAFSEPIISKTARDRILINPLELEQWKLKKGDLIFARRSLVFEGSGKCSIVGDLLESHVYESSMIRVRLNFNLVNPMFAFFYFSASFSRSQILSTTKQVTISGIDSQQLKSLLFVLPPKNEQEKLVDYIQNSNHSHQKSKNKIESAIALLKEYRTGSVSPLLAN